MPTVYSPLSVADVILSYNWISARDSGRVVLPKFELILRQDTKFLKSLKDDLYYALK